MTTPWKISNSVARIVSDCVAQYLKNPGPPDFDYCPSIMWALGGEADLAGGGHLSLSAHYDLGIMNRTDIEPEGFVAVSHPDLGIVGFRPNQDDLESARRLIDYDGETIVVR